VQNKVAFKKWHEDSLDADNFLQLWSNRFCDMFEVIKARKIKVIHVYIYVARTC
jgi:hypothetical protein